MSISENAPGYTGTAKALHWTIVALLIVQFVLTWTMPEIKRDTKPDTLINLHLSFGALILGMAIIRLGWRATHAEPPSEDDLPPWQLQSARITHWLLYALLFVLPILGWINASWRGFTVSVFGLFELPKLMATRAPGFGWTGDVHTLLAYYAMLTLIVLHVAAGLYHYFGRRDRVLQRMLPGA
ncbi:MAG TPA: cytochrome b [Pseudolabrys sp.]|nr:cytochrome b [Pseudolabrys sp.]